MAQESSAMTPSLVFVPSVRVDRGMGHLRRCLAAARSGGGAVFYAEEPALFGAHPLFSRADVQSLAEQAGVPLWTDWPANVVVPRVVCDLQAAPPSALGWLQPRAERLIAWDDGGAARGLFPYLVDSLPHDSQPEPNVRLPGLLGLAVGPKPPSFQRPIRKILVVFGGADPAGLTLRFLRFVEGLRKEGRWPFALTVVRGPLSRFIVPPETEVLESPPALASLLGQWDLTVTSWGLTALESLAAGTPVLLLNPSAYHEKLARAARIPTFGVRSPRKAEFFSGLADAPEAARQAYDALIQPPLDAGAYFRDFQGTDARCPVCRTAGHPTFFRTLHKTYHRCRTCRMEFLSVHQLPPKEYSDSYFFEDYQKQYGKTYLQDFAHIQALGRQRLAFLDDVAGPKPDKRILDVGCAYGPFLAAVAEAGYRPLGLDVSVGAVTYVRDTLGYPAVCESFLDVDWARAFPGEPLPDVVTMWYVIEHFPDLDAVLRQVAALLPVGGVFAFSTPNGRGITRSFQPRKFWTESPDDHFSIWNPANTPSVLSRYGFEVLDFRITGHHPERFPGLPVTARRRLALVGWLSQKQGWGDTFEVYARKVKEPL